jgi:nucleoside-specific outer membrane channel protein Tsx
VLYEISGTITFEYPSVENYNITNTASKIRYSATIQETEVITTPGTNKLSFGSTAPQSLYYGNSPVQEVYLGNTLLYSVGSTTEKNIYGIKINLLGAPVDLANSEYRSVKINGVTLAVDTEKKVGSAQLTVTAVSGSVVAPSNIDIYA